MAAGVASMMLPVETRGKDLADVVTPEDNDDDTDGVTSSADRVGNSLLLRRESAHNDETCIYPTNKISTYGSSNGVHQ